MHQIFFDKGIQLSPLQNKIIGVIGYGNQGQAQALNIRDSGLTVIVGNRRDAYLRTAQRDGFSVSPIPEVVRKAEILIIALPDEIQEQVYQRDFVPNLRSGQVLDLASSYGIRFQCIRPPKDVDVVMMSPRAMGVTVREAYVRGVGVPGLVAVGQDYSGKARRIVLALAKAVGCARAGVLECTFEEESDVNLFNEQALQPMLFQAILLGYEVLVEHGVRPEIAALELYASGELGDIFREMARQGIFRQMRFHSPTSCYGGLSRYAGLKNTNEIKKRMFDVIRGIRTGKFAREWGKEQARGYPNLKKLKERAAQHPINGTELKLKRLNRS